MMLAVLSVLSLLGNGEGLSAMHAQTISRLSGGRASPEQRGVFSRRLVVVCSYRPPEKALFSAYAPDIEQNVLGGPIYACCHDVHGTGMNPGYRCEGYCSPGKVDDWELYPVKETIAVEMSEAFLDYMRKKRKMDLTIPREPYADGPEDPGFPGLLPGDRWCLDPAHFRAALDDGWLGKALAKGTAPKVFLQATHKLVLNTITLEELLPFKMHDPDADLGLTETEYWRKKTAREWVPWGDRGIGNSLGNDVLERLVETSTHRRDFHLPDEPPPEEYLDTRIGGSEWSDALMAEVMGTDAPSGSEIVFNDPTVTPGSQG